MMSVIGDPSRFSVEYALAANPGGAWMYGHCCYWCDGKRVGDYDSGTSLRDILFQLDELAKHEPRINPRFNEMPAPSVFRTIDAALFGSIELSVAQVAEDEQWSNHQTLPSVDVFDSWKDFLVEDKQIARLLLSQDPFADAREITLALIASIFLRHLDLRQRETI
jgi:hypothetical protein